jgi:hypothetical protein
MKMKFLLFFLVAFKLPFLFAQIPDSLNCDAINIALDLDDFDIRFKSKLNNDEKIFFIDTNNVFKNCIIENEEGKVLKIINEWYTEIERNAIIIDRKILNEKKVIYKFENHSSLDGLLLFFELEKNGKWELYKSAVFDF